MQVATTANSLAPAPPVSPVSSNATSAAVSSTPIPSHSLATRAADRADRPREPVIAGSEVYAAISMAFESAGFTNIPSAGIGSGAAEVAAVAGQAAGSGAASVTPAAAVSRDMSQFVSAIAGAQVTKGSTPATAQKPSFTAHMAALIASASRNSVPPDLQRAFANLMSSLMASNPPDPAPTVTLQQILSLVQQNLGYGSAGPKPVGAGNLISAQA